MTTGSIIRASWNTFKQRPWFLIFVSLALILLGYVPGIIGSILAGIFQALGSVILGAVVAAVISFVGQWLVMLGTVRLYLKAVDDTPGVSWSDMFRFEGVVRFTITYILYILVVMAGLLMFIVPGVIWMFKYMFAPYLSADKGMRPMEALRESARLSDGIKTRIAVVGFAYGFIFVAGLLAFVVGALVAYPLMMLGFMHLYRAAQQRLETGAAIVPLSGKEKGVLIAGIILIPVMFTVALGAAVFSAAMQKGRSAEMDAKMMVERMNAATNQPTTGARPDSIVDDPAVETPMIGDAAEGE